MIDVRSSIIGALSREFLLDLEDALAAAALKAVEVIRPLSLNSKRSGEAVGQVRFRLQEEGFERVVEQHGFEILRDGILLDTDLKIFQPFVRFSSLSGNVILGFASMPEKQKIPPKNKSRAAGVHLNFHLQPRLDLDIDAPKAGDIFVLLLVSRHRERAGLIEEIAIGVINAGYSEYLFYEPLDDFLKGYQVLSTPSETGSDGRAKIKLRKGATRFLPSEQQVIEKSVGDAKD